MRIKVGSEPQDVAATSDGVWVAEYGDRSVVRLDSRSRRVVARIKLPFHPVALAAGDGVVAVAIVGPPL
jgi:DNA-binding beta-propeller fold protein YncE